MKRSDLFLVCVLLSLVAVVYGWCAVAGSAPWRLGEPQKDKYTLLVEGFMKGQLSLDAPVSPELLQSPNPYDPAQRKPGTSIHDASLYNGRYYIYFGVVPAVVLLLPFRAVAGFGLPLGASIFVFCLLGYLAALLLFLRIRRAFFPRAGFLSTAAAGLALGFFTFAPMLLRRHSTYELPIASGACFALFALLFLFQSLYGARWRLTALALSSLCLGLAFGSRPIYILAPLCLLPALWGWFRISREARTWRPMLRALAAAVVPWCAVGGLLALYNYLRFGSPFEFGVSYILSGVYEAKVPHFGLGYLPYNLWAFLLTPPTVGPYFPFFGEGRIPVAAPPFHFTSDGICGVLPVLPIFAAGVLLPFFKRKRLPASLCDNGTVEPGPGAIFGATAWLGFSVLGLMLCFCAAMSRYLGDILPAFAVLAACGLLAAEELAARSGKSLLARTLGGVTVLSSLSFSLVALLVCMLTRDGIFTWNPDTYAWVSRAANRCVATVETVVGRRHGALEFRLSFPSGLPKAPEEIFRLAEVSQAPRLLIAPEGAGFARLGLSEAGLPVCWSAPLPWSRETVYRVSVESGELMPPAFHPLYEACDEAQRTFLRYRTQVSVDGVPVLWRWRKPSLQGSARWSLAQGFGRLESPRRRDLGAVPSLREATRLILKLPGGEAAPVERLSLDTLPASAAALEQLVSEGSLRWRLVLKDGTQLESRSFERSAGQTVLLELGRLEEGAKSTGGAGWFVVQDGSFSPLTVPREASASSAPAAFSGRIVYGGPFPSAHYRPAGDRFALSVVFPTKKAGAREPLLVSGSHGKADFLFVEYLGENKLRLGWDHWGTPTAWSPELSVSEGKPLRFEIEPDGCFEEPKGPASLRICFGGAPFWQVPGRFYTVSGDEIYFGWNPVGGSSCRGCFSGELR